MSEETETKTEAVQDVRGGKPSASGMHRLFMCPGSFMAEQIAGKDDETEFARHGTELHAHMEHGTTPEDPTDAEAVAWCRETEAALALRWLGDGYESVREQRLWSRGRRFSGQADDCMFSKDGKTALVIDYKFGRVAVDSAERNHQLAALAVLVRDNYPDVETVYVSILQPFVSMAEPKVVMFTPEGAAAADEAINRAIDCAEAPGAVLRPSAVACKYCRALATCTAADGYALTCSAVQRWDALAPAVKAELFQRAKVARKMADKIEAAIRADLEGGREVPGLTLGAGRTSFTVTDAQSAFAVLNTGLGVTADEFTACCKVQISNLDKLVHEKFKEREPGHTVKQSKERLRALLAAFGENKTTAGTIKEGGEA